MDDTPAPYRSRDFLLATPELATALTSELDALIAGDSPYRDYPGDLWRTAVKGRRDLPMRVYRPPGHKGPLPLVMALHGAGGDENFLFELAGDGYLKRLADEHGFVVACPSTASVTATPEAFDAIVETLRADYTLTEDLPLLFGHSMGGMGVSGLLFRRPDAIKSAVCFAGFNGAPKDGPPTLVLGAEFDPIARPSGLRRAAESAAGIGANTTFEELANQGHTLALTEAFDRAIKFWSLCD